MRVPRVPRSELSDAAVVGRLLDEYHCRNVAPDRVRPLSGSERGTRVSYLLRLPDGASQLIRAFRADAGVPVHARDLGVTVADWLLGRARVLSLLAAAGYPAPRPVPTRTGELIGVAGPWLTWAVSYVPGPVVTPTLSQLRLLAAALARLHSVPVGQSGRERGAASADPAVAAPATIARLDAVRPIVPASLRSLHAEIEAVTAAVAAGIAASGARSFVHGDPWARNAVQAGQGSVTLIGWETSGLGCPVLDLGHCLMECHVDAAVPDGEPERWLITADEDRIAAVASGYASVRPLSAAEAAILPWAVRFPAAVAAAVHLEAALIGGVRGRAIDARLARLRNRLAVGEAVAAAAVRALASGAAGG